MNGRLCSLARWQVGLAQRAKAVEHVIRQLVGHQFDGTANGQVDFTALDRPVGAADRHGAGGAGIGVGRNVIADTERLSQVQRLLIDPATEDGARRCRVIQQLIQIDTPGLIHAATGAMQIVTVCAVLVGPQEQSTAGVGKGCRGQTGVLQGLSGDKFGQNALPRMQRGIAAETRSDLLPLTVVDKPGRAVVEAQRLEPWMFANTGLLLADPLEQRGGVQCHRRHQTESGHIDFSCPHENSYTVSLTWVATNCSTSWRETSSPSAGTSRALHAPQTTC